MGGITIGGKPVSAPIETGVEPDHSFFEDTLPASFRLDNPAARPFFDPITGDFSLDVIGNLDTPDFEPEIGYNQYATDAAGDYSNIRGYEEFKDNFADDDSPEAVEWRKSKIDREQRDRGILADSGGYAIAAGVITGIVDPINAIPVFGTVAKSLSIGRTALRAGLLAAGSGAAATAIGEGFLQSQQETRTFGESAAIVTGATLLTGVLGSAVGLVSAKRLAREAGDIDEFLNLSPRGEPDDLGPYQVPYHEVEVDADVAAAQLKLFNDDGPVKPSGTRQKKWEDETAEEFAENDIAASLGISTVAKAVSPAMRVAMSSPFKTAKEMLQDISTTHWFYKKNLQATPEATNQSAESLTRIWNRGMEESIDETRRLFIQMRTGNKTGGAVAFNRIASGDSLGITKGMNFKEFKRTVGKYARFNKESAGEVFGDDLKNMPEEIIQAGEGWRTRIYEPMRKRLIETGVMDEKLHVKTADYYMNRKWNKKVIRRKSRELKGILRTYLGEKHPEIEDVGKEVDNIILRLLDTAPARVDGSFGVRTLDISDKKVLDFLEHDIEKIAGAYVRTWAPATELRAKFSDLDLATGRPDAAFKLMDDEASEMIGAYRDANPRKKGESQIGAENRWEKKEAKLFERLKEDKSTLQSLINLNLGHKWDGGHISDPTKLQRAGRVFRKLNVMRQGGEFVLSSFPDPFALGMTHGYTRSIGTIAVNAVTNFDAVKASRAEVRRWGVAAESVFSRAQIMSDTFDELAEEGNVVERLVGAGSQRFFTHNLQTPWNEMWKMMAGQVSAGRMLDTIDAMSLGKAKKKDVQWLARLGIGENEAGKIHTQWRNSATQSRGRVNVANSDEWIDREVATIFKAAGVKDVEGVIVTPGHGDKPFLASTEMGKSFFQYKTFFMASTINYTMQISQRLSQGEVLMLIKPLPMIAAGTAVYAMKQILRGEEISRDPFKLVAEGVDRSGTSGFISEGVNIIDKISQGKLGPSQFFDEEMSRYQMRSITGTIAGPTIGSLQEVALFLHGLFGDDFGPTNAKAGRRLLAYNQHFAFRKVFDKLEDFIADVF